MAPTWNSQTNNWTDAQGHINANAPFAGLMTNFDLHDPSDFATYDDQQGQWVAKDPRMQQYLYDNASGSDGNITHQLGISWDKLPKTGLAGDGNETGSILGHAAPAGSPNDMINGNMVKWDPNYGWITDARNRKEQKNPYETIAAGLGTGFIGGMTMAPLISGLGSAMGGGQFANFAANAAVKGGMNMLQGSKFNPTSLVGMGLGALGVPAWASGLASSAAGMMMNKRPSQPQPQNHPSNVPKKPTMPQYKPQYQPQPQQYNGPPMTPYMRQVLARQGTVNSALQRYRMGRGG